MFILLDVLIIIVSLGAQGPGLMKRIVASLNVGPLLDERKVFLKVMVHVRSCKITHRLMCLGNMTC